MNPSAIRPIDADQRMRRKRVIRVAQHGAFGADDPDVVAGRLMRRDGVGWNSSWTSGHAIS